MMKRRNFLSSLGAGLTAPTLLQSQISSVQNSSADLVRPKALRPGDTVGLITPATYISDPDRLILVERTLKHFGLAVKLGKNTGKRLGAYSASVNERLDDLHQMFRDPAVQAVFPILGGYGAMHLLDRIDYDLLRRNPKIFLGYSDITALHLAITKHARLMTFHGPNVLSRFSDYTQKHFRQALFETRPIGKVTNPPESNRLRPAHTLRTVRPGTATGALVGGNLTLVCSLLGTPYEIDTRGRLLFLEDINEEPYRIDRMLTQLRLAGKFDQATGIIFGECTDCGPRDYKPSNSPYTLGEILNHLLGPLRVPVLSGLTIGHTDDQLTLPIGCLATLDADAGTLDIKEAGVR
ncbi:MAG: LD-carboxypeptidase [Pyrinomonadaceae bacterium]|nr:LD-carboxypeptidase [Pyrinomonadaceae bacterium]